MALINEPAEPETLDQNAVLSYLTDLSDDDYKKLIKVADVYRTADKKANEIMDKVPDGDKVEVRIIPANSGSTDLSFEETEEKGTTENAKTTK